MNNYDEVRRAFYSLFRLQILRAYALNVEVSSIGYGVLEQAMDWKGRMVDWDWFEIKRKFRNVPARFELAISIDGVLCGLMIGKPSRGRRHISAYYLERNPDHRNPLKGQSTAIFLDGLALYGLALGCTHARLIDPLKAVISRYEQAGFVRFTKKNRLYCEKSLEN